MFISPHQSLLGVSSCCPPPVFLSHSFMVGCPGLALLLGVPWLCSLALPPLRRFYMHIHCRQFAVASISCVLSFQFRFLDLPRFVIIPICRRPPLIKPDYVVLLSCSGMAVGTTTRTYAQMYMATTASAVYCLLLPFYHATNSVRLLVFYKYVLFRRIRPLN